MHLFHPIVERWTFPVYSETLNPFATVIVFIVDFCVCPTIVPFQMKIKNLSKRHFRVPSGEKGLKYRWLEIK